MKKFFLLFLCLIVLVPLIFSKNFSEVDAYTVDSFTDSTFVDNRSTGILCQSATYEFVDSSREECDIDYTFLVGLSDHQSLFEISNSIFCFVFEGSHSPYDISYPYFHFVPLFDGISPGVCNLSFSDSTGYRTFSGSFTLHVGCDLSSLVVIPRLFDEHINSTVLGSMFSITFRLRCRSIFNDFSSLVGMSGSATSHVSAINDVLENTDIPYLTFFGQVGYKFFVGDTYFFRTVGYNKGVLDALDFDVESAFEAGYQLGFESASLSSFNEGYLAGLAFADTLIADSYQQGYINGLFDAQTDVAGNFATGWLSSVFSGVQSILTIDILPGVALGWFIYIPLIMALLWFIIKIFLGS